MRPLHANADRYHEAIRQAQQDNYDQAMTQGLANGHTVERIHEAMFFLAGAGLSDNQTRQLRRRHPVASTVTALRNFRGRLRGHTSRRSEASNT